MAKIGDITYFNNEYLDVPSENEYKEVEKLIEFAEAYSILAQKTTYIFDYYKRSFLYVSDNFLDLMEMGGNEIESNSTEFCPNSMSNDDADMLVNHSNEIFKFMKRLPETERRNYTFSFPLIFNGDRKGVKRFFSVRTKMLRFRPNGDMWLTLYVVSLPTKNDAHNLMAFDNKGNRRWIFNGTNWDRQDMPKLTDNERQMLMYSAMGYSALEISEKIARGIDTVKSYRRSIFKKLEVDNITEAVNYALANHLI